MKIAQWFVPKRRLLKVAQERTQEKLQYVNIDSSVNSYDKKLLLSYQESLARFAQRHNIAINFENDANKTKMHIFKTSLTPHAIKRKGQGLWYFATPEYKACEHLHNIKNENFFSGLKEKAKELANTEGEQQTVCRYPFRIRHENKYYSYPR